MKCSCHSQKQYTDCCKPYHQGEKPPNAQALMRSRYSAYALKNVAYIIRTTHPNNSDASTPQEQRAMQIKEFCEQTLFVGLEINDFTENAPFATVTFTASLMQNGQDASYTEKSEFEKIEGQWLYLKGMLI